MSTSQFSHKHSAITCNSVMPTRSVNIFEVPVGRNNISSRFTFTFIKAKEKIQKINQQDFRKAPQNVNQQ